jgi:hypothetical protein
VMELPLPNGGEGGAASYPAWGQAQESGFNAGVMELTLPPSGEGGAASYPMWGQAQESGFNAGVMELPLPLLFIGHIANWSRVEREELLAIQREARLRNLDLTLEW